MNTTLTTLLWFLLSPPNPPMELSFEVHGNYDRPVKMEKIKDARTISDFWEGYPKAWITDYVSSEISATCGSKKLIGIGLNDTLTVEQKRILQTADLGSAIRIMMQYRYKNPVTNDVYMNQMNLSVAVVPDVEASFPEGYEKLKAYLAENGIKKLPSGKPTDFKPVTVYFTVNEEGAITNDYISQSSGNAATDRILLEAIHKMPKWKPAQSFTGTKVKQEFVFAVGNVGC